MRFSQTFFAWAGETRHFFWLVFATVFLAVAMWESWQPKLVLSIATEKRWGDHTLLFGVSALLHTLAVRLIPVGAAKLVEGSPVGLLNHAWIPFGARCVVAVLILDFIHYWAHRTFHSFGMLWRVHEIHHSDPDYDVSTATRFHPLDVLPTQAVQFAAVLLLAPPPAAVFAAELLAMLVNFVVHANASFPQRAETVLRAVFITPDLHRIHHSEEPLDYGRNFGQTFSWWDRIFRTYATAGGAGGEVVTGVKGTVTAEVVGVTMLLRRPFRRDGRK